MCKNGMEENVKDLKLIEIIFENCDVMVISGTDIKQLNIGEIKNKKYNEAENIKLVVDKNTDKSYYQFGIEEEQYKITKFERIEANDITGIKLVHKNGDIEDYTVPYKEKDEDILGSPNTLQNNYYEDDSFVIEINK